MWYGVPCLGSSDTEEPQYHDLLPACYIYCGLVGRNSVFLTVIDKDYPNTLPWYDEWLKQLFTWRASRR